MRIIIGGAKSTCAEEELVVEQAAYAWALIQDYATKGVVGLTFSQVTKAFRL